MDEPGGERRCGSCGEPNPARAKFCLECGTPLKLDLVDQLPQESGTPGERRVVSVLFADLSGFTAYSEGSDVEDVRAIAQEAAERLGDIVIRYGGTVDKIIGDCVMAVFGAPVAHEDDPERAVRAALDMQSCVEENRDRFGGLNLCVGVNTGEAMYAPVGTDGYTVLGDTVNTAARLQSAAARGTVVIGEPTYSAVSDVIDCEPMEPIKAKNKAEPVPAWRAAAVRGEKRRYKPVRASLVGREEEMRRLRELWELTGAERRPHTAVLLGPAGIGKSRLIEALTADVASSALVLRGRCLPYGEGITYWPLIEIIQQLAEIHHDDDQTIVSRKLGALLESLGIDDLDELRTIAVALANLIGAPTTPRGTYTATKISSGELHWGMRRILELRSRALPMVLVLEDLHWAEPTLLELVEYVFEARDGAALLGIVSARPELQESGASIVKPGANRRVFELEPLGEQDARRILTELFRAAEFPEGHIAQLLHAAGGNPLFLEELVQMWIEASSQSEDAAQTLRDFSVPSSLQALIDSRLDRLPVEERRVLTFASVIGDVFWSGALTAISRGNGQIPSFLDALEGRDLIRSQSSSTIGGEREFVFKHGVIRDVAYGRLTKAERATLHERCGDWIAALPGGGQEFAEIIAYHLEQACRLASEITMRASRAPILAAVKALSRATDKAEAREGIREAAGFIGRAIDLLAEGYPETRIDLRLRRSRILAEMGELDLAYDEMSKAAAAAGPDRPDLRCRALLSLVATDVAMGRASEARARIDEAEELARSIDDPLLQIRAAWVRADVLTLDGSVEEATESLRAAVALAEEAGDPEYELNAHMFLGTLYYNTGLLALAGEEFERSIDLARAQGSLRMQAWLTAFLGLIRYYRGPREDAEGLYAQAAEWMERTNDRYMLTQLMVWRSRLRIQQGDLKDAMKLLRTAWPLARDMGGSPAADVARTLSEALSRQGRTTEAREIAAQARKLASTEDPVAAPKLLIAEALSVTDDSALRIRFSQALALLEQSGDEIEVGEARLSYARALRQRTDDEGVIDQLERAREVFGRIGAVAAVAEIDGELASISTAVVRTQT